MAKLKLTKVQANLLAAIADATKKNEVFYVGKSEDVIKLVNEKLIEVNPEMQNDKQEAASRATAAGVELVSKSTKPAASAPVATPSTFAIIDGAVPPPSKRGAGSGGAPAKYPFAALGIGQSFFVKDTEVTSGDAMKSLQSSVAAANAEYSEPTGEQETVTRTKRGEGNKAVLDEAGNKVKETVTRDKRKATRKFIVRDIEGGKAYGGWTAPENGALITRVALEA